MKLLLTSGGIENERIQDALEELLEKPFFDTSLIFIPTASFIEEGDKWWLIEDLNKCKEMGFKSVDVVDISALPESVWKKRVEDADVIWVEGGNTFHLMYWINKTGLNKLLPELLKEKIYVGVSAGSMVVTPKLVLADSEKEIVEKIGEDIEENGLGLVDFLIVPHAGSENFPECSFKRIEEKAKNVDFSVYALDDNSAIKVVDEKVEVISEGKWKKFN